MWWVISRIIHVFNWWQFSFRASLLLVFFFCERVGLLRFVTFFVASSLSLSLDSRIFLGFHRKRWCWVLSMSSTSSMDGWQFDFEPDFWLVIFFSNAQLSLAAWAANHATSILSRSFKENACLHLQLLATTPSGSMVTALLGKGICDDIRNSWLSFGVWMGFILVLCLFFSFHYCGFFVLELYRTRDAGCIISPLSSIELGTMAKNGSLQVGTKAGFC